MLYHIPDVVTRKKLEKQAAYVAAQLQLPLVVTQPVDGYYDLYTTSEGNGLVTRLGCRMTGRELYAYLIGFVEGKDGKYHMELAESVLRANEYKRWHENYQKHFE